MGHGAWGMGHGAMGQWGNGHRAWGMERMLLDIERVSKIERL